MVQARYAHTNLIAQDWRALAEFYQRVFGCVPVPPERDLSGPIMEAGTGLPGAHLRGMHLRLPGYGDAGPTLEIFNYSALEQRPATRIGCSEKSACDTKLAQERDSDAGQHQQLPKGQAEQ